MNTLAFLQHLFPSGAASQRSRVEVAASVVDLAIRNFLTGEVKLVERGNVSADIVSAGLVDSRRAPKEIDILGCHVLALAAAADRPDSVISDCGETRGYGKLEVGIEHGTTVNEPL